VNAGKLSIKDLAKEIAPQKSFITLFPFYLWNDLCKDTMLFFEKKQIVPLRLINWLIRKQFIGRKGELVKIVDRLYRKKKTIDGNSLFFIVMMHRQGCVLFVIPAWQ
jgi:hypothetical protein